VHRLLGPCEGRQSWRRPNNTQSATSNCNAHDPVTRRRGDPTVYPQAAPGSPTVCEGLDVEQSRLRVLEPTFFAKGAEVGGVRERALGSPTHPLAHRGAWRRRAGSPGRGSSERQLRTIRDRRFEIRGFLSPRRRGATSSQRLFAGSSSFPLYTS
jgi:hypothetical protein